MWTTWTLFRDGFTHGKRKTRYTFILIEAHYQLALQAFQTVFGFSPLHVTCPCCGPDYDVETGPLHRLLEGISVRQTENARDCRTLAEFEERGDTLLIRRDDLPNVPTRPKKLSRPPKAKVADLLPHTTTEALMALKSSLV